MNTPLVIILAAVIVGLALIGVPIWFYHRGMLNKEDLLTILIGELCLLTLVQFVLAISRFSYVN